MGDNVLSNFLITMLANGEDDDTEELILFAGLVDSIRPRITNFIENVVHEYSDKKFQENFRLERSTCYRLINMFRDSRFYPKIYFAQPPKSPECHILAFLWYAANKTSLRSVAGRFDMSKSTLFVTNNRVMDFLMDLSPQVIRFPYSDEEKNEISENFEELTDITGVVGCMDGSDVNICTPVHKIPATYINRHDQKSMTLQGVCDAQKRFLDCFVGPPSRCHDSSIFHFSFIYPLIQQMGDDYHLLADSAYGLTKNVLTPYRDYGRLTRQQRNFNNQLSKARVKIENSFGLLKSRFRHLVITEFWTPEKIAISIMCCCVLHKLVIDDDSLYFNDDEIAEINNYHHNNYINNGNNNNNPNNNNNQLAYLQAERKRNNIARNL